MRASRVLQAAALLLLAAGALAHVRLIHPSSGSPLGWAIPQNVSIVINSAGSDDLPDGSHETALRLAIQEWNSVSGTTANLTEDMSPLSQARTDWWSSGIHTILFDEDGSTGVLSFGTVAITIYSFDGNNRLRDADILFNGLDFSFTTSGQAGRFDVQDVATHELGHLLGFDHSGWAGATMFPFVSQSVILHRSLSEDEVHALRDAYPLAAFGRITGSVERTSDGTAVRGAHVVARDANGRTVASVLTRTNGTYTLPGLDPGTYTVYAVPLGTGALFDAPVDVANFGPGHIVETDFMTTTYPALAVIAAVETVALGPLAVADDVALNLGTEFDTFPKRVVAGASQTIILRGTSLFPPASIVASDPDLILGLPVLLGSQISFQVTAPASEEPGHVDLTVTNVFGESSVLPAALEITPPSPVVSGAAPAVGTVDGGTFVTITGTGFLPGAHIVLGDQVYTDGVNGTAVTSPTTITLTMTPTVAGTHDVVVIDATGMEGRLVGGFLAQAIPTIATVFPAAGATAGGTTVVLTGTSFLPGVVVRIGGVDQGAVTITGPGQVSFTTTPGALGSWMLEVENLDGGLAISTFTYGAQPDPTFAAVTPASGPISGGQTATLTGSGFTLSTLVDFGADPDTGAGGTPAASVTFLDANTLEVVTPSFPTGGAQSVMVSDPGTGQAHLVAGAYAVTVPNSGGGGCTMRPIGGSDGSRALLFGGWWLAVVLLVLGRRARRVGPALRAI